LNNYRLGHRTQIAALWLAISTCAVIMLLAGTPKISCATIVQSQKPLERLHETLAPLAPPGEHIQRRVTGLIGASGPVTLDIVQGKQENYEDQHPVATQICIVRAWPKSCYVPRIGSNIFYVAVKAEPVEIAPGHQALLLWTGSYQYDEPSILLSLVVMGHKGKLVDTLPHVIFGPQDESKLWYDPVISPYLLVSTAVAIWMEDDNSQFGNHRYWIRTYEYCPELVQYTEANFISLEKKFPGLDARHKENLVINRVMPTLKSRLSRRSSKCVESKEKLK